MKGNQAIELIQQHHVNMPIGQAIVYLNEGIKEFCRRTNIFKTSYVQDSVAGQRYYTLDDNILDVKEVHFNDVSIPRLIGKPVIDDDEFVSATNSLPTPTTTSNERYWYLDTRRIGIVEKLNSTVVSRDDKTSNYQSCSVAGVEIRLFVTAYPTLFSQTNLSSETVLASVPGSFEHIIVNYVIAQGYILPDNLNPDMHGLFTNKYEMGIREAKQFSNKSAGGTGRIMPCDF
jgi:hypothetical protein